MFLLFPRYFKGNKYLNNCCKAFYSMLKIFIFVTFSEVRFNFFFQGSGGKHLPGPATPRGRGCHASLLLSPTFLRSKKKKGKLREKKTIFKAETIESLSPRSKCYCFSHSRVYRIEKIFLSANHGGRQYFSVFHGPIHFEIHFAGPYF